MRTRYVGVSGGVLSKDSCRGDGGGRSIHAKIGTVYKVLIPDTTYLTNVSPDSNKGTAGTLQVNNSIGSYLKGLLHVDLSAYAGRVVIAATLHVHRTLIDAVHVVYCHEVLHEWLEMEATFYSRKTGVAWDVAGMGVDQDYDGIALDFVSTTVPGFYSWNVKAAVEAWLAGTRPNYGLVLLKMYVVQPVLSFSSDDTASPELRPYLNLTLA